MFGDATAREGENLDTAAIPFHLECDDLLAAFTNFLRFDISGGNASGDTIVTYWKQVKQFLKWCEANRIQPREVDRDAIKSYRWWLTEERRYATPTIGLKLSAIGRFYDAAIEYGMLVYNPVSGIKPPRETIDPAARITYLEIEEIEVLLKSVGKENPPLGGTLAPCDGARSHPLQYLRDRLLLGIMVLEGTRTIEMCQLNIGDVVYQGRNVGLRVASKRRMRVVPLTPQLAELLKEYIHHLRQDGYDTSLTEPLFVSLSPRSKGMRLHRRSLRTIVDRYLVAANLKEVGNRRISAHSLRHTAATMALKHGASLRQVQDLLGHADPRTTAVYTHVGDRWVNNPALRLEIDLE
jgi:integrase/recombinase XerD